MRTRRTAALALADVALAFALALVVFAASDIRAAAPSRATPAASSR